MAEKYTSKFVFPRLANLFLPIAVLSLVGAAAYVPVVGALGVSPENTDVGYQPEQPVPYSHALHVGQLGLDCRYCHNTVDKAAFAAIPPTQTCMTCHTNVRTDSEKLKPVRDSWASGESIQWVKVHDLPDYAYFNHAAHVNKGVSCVDCHSRVDHMDETGVYQAKNLSMGWCIDCHRNPEQVLRPKDQVTNLGWTVDKLSLAQPGTESFDIFKHLQAEHKTDNITQEQLGAYLKQHYAVRDHQFMTSCSTCHR